MQQKTKSKQSLNAIQEEDTQEENYYGETLNDFRHGNGTLTFINHNKYKLFKGQFLNDHMVSGKLEYLNGDVYLGQFLNQKRHGQGQINYQNKSVYEGFWYEDMRQGKGIFQHGQIMYDGFWEMDKKQGLGKLVNLDGSVFEGHFHDGSFEGYGKLVKKDKEQIQGIWKDGNIINTSDQGQKNQQYEQNHPNKNLFQIQIKKLTEQKLDLISQLQLLQQKFKGSQQEDFDLILIDHKKNFEKQYQVLRNEIKENKEQKIIDNEKIEELNKNNTNLIEQIQKYKKMMTKLGDNRENYDIYDQMLSEILVEFELDIRSNQNKNKEKKQIVTRDQIKKDRMNQTNLDDYFQYETQLTTYQKNQLKVMNEQLELKNEEISRQKDTIIDLNVTIDEWIRQKQVSQWETEYLLSKREIIQLQNLVGQKDKIIGDLKKQVQRKNVEMDSIIMEYQSFQDSVKEKITVAIQQKQETQNKLEQRLKVSTDKYIRLQKQYLNLQEQNKDEIQDIQIKYNQLKSILLQRDQQIQDLRADIQKHIGIISENEKKIYDLKQKLNEVHREQYGYSEKEVRNYLEICKQNKDNKIMLTIYEKELEQKSQELKRIYMITHLIPQLYDPDLDVNNQFQRRALDSANYTFTQEGSFFTNYLSGAKSDCSRVIKKIAIYGESKGFLSQIEINVQDTEDENHQHFIAIHKNTLEMQKWSYQVDQGEAIFQMQKLSSIVKVDIRCNEGNATVISANILIIYSDAF